MKWLLALVAYFAILWGWRSLTAWMKPKKQPGPVHEPDKEQAKSDIKPDDIEDAHFRELKDTEDHAE